MSTLTTTHLAPTDYGRGLIDGQVGVLELLAADIAAGQDPKALIRALLEHSRRRAAELREAAGR